MYYQWNKSVSQYFGLRLKNRGKCPKGNNTPKTYADFEEKEAIPF